MFTGPGRVQNLRSTGATLNSITVTWDELNCVDRNGELTGYRIEYGTTTFDNMERVTGTSFTATGLFPLTTYMFRVAAVNGFIGTYSSLSTSSEGTMYTCVICNDSTAPIVIVSDSVNGSECECK